MTIEEIEELKRTAAKLKTDIDFINFDVKEKQKSNNPYTVDEWHLIEEQLHYMNGYLRLVKIRLFRQGIEV